MRTPGFFAARPPGAFSSASTRRACSSLTQSRTLSYPRDDWLTVFSRLARSSAVQSPSASQRRATACRGFPSFARIHAERVFLHGVGKGRAVPIDDIAALGRHVHDARLLALPSRLQHRVLNDLQIDEADEHRNGPDAEQHADDHQARSGRLPPAARFRMLRPWLLLA